MKYIYTGDDGATELDAYKRYIESVRDALPRGVHDFIFHEGRFDFYHKKCMHDSWIERIAIAESGAGDRREKRTLEVEILALGSYHDGYHRLLYSGVRGYNFALADSMRGEAPIGHADWLVDEVVLLDSNLVSHEIQFSDSGLLKITFTDMVYEWIEKPGRTQ